jgi:hypothetical protein
MTNALDPKTVQMAIAGKIPDAGGNVRINCPNCEGGQRDPLSVNVNTGEYHCFRCPSHSPTDGNYLKENGTDHKPLAQFLYDQARPVNTHPYAEKKQIRPNEIRQDQHGNWIIPLTDHAGRLQTIQFINPDGVKFLLSKAKNNGVGFKGAVYIIEGRKDLVIWCEGIATGWSIHHATGATVYCCGSKSNLDPVMAWSVDRYPDSRKIVAGDNDKSGDGQRVGAAAARKYNVLFAVPGIPGTDFNDMAIDAGPEAVKKVLDNAKVPGQTVDIEIPNGITAADLIKKDFPEPKWAVRDILPEGLNILGGKPKGGKSILSLNLCLAIAMGGKALQTVPVDQGTTIYLALEDVQRRLKTRLNQMLVYDPAPDNLLLFTEWPRLGSGGGKALDVLLAKNPDARLVVIDTLAKIRPPQKSNGNLYTEDYDIIDALKGIADKHTVSVLIVHHLRKMESSDPFDMFSGTLGLTGAADGLLVMKRNGTGQTVLSMRGRDVEERELLIELDPLIMTWKSLGEAAEVQATKERQRLFDCLKDADGPLSPKEIEGLTGLRDHYIRKTLPVLLKEGTILKKERGKYIFIGNNGHNGNSGNNGNIGNNSEIVPDTGPIVPGGYKAGNNCKSLTGKGSGAFVPDVPDVPDLCKSCEHFHSDSKSCLHSDFPVPVEVNQAILNCPGGGD